MANVSTNDDEKLFSSQTLAQSNYVGIPARQTSEHTEKTKYSKMYEGQLTNALTTVNSKKTKHVEKLLDDGNQGWLFDLSELGGGEVSLSDPDNNTLSMTSSQLLDIVGIYLTEKLPYKASDEQLVKHLDCVLKVDSYMKIRGITSREDAIKQLKKDFRALYNASTVATITRHAKGGKKFSEKLEVRYIDAIPKGHIKDYAHFRIALSFARYLAHTTMMPYPIIILTASKNKNVYYIGKKLAAHYNMNRKKTNATSISVDALLNYTPEIPTFEEEYSRSRHYEQKCIRPLDKALTELVNIGVLTEYTWWHGKNKQLRDDELNNWSFNRDSGKDFFIHFEFKEHPFDSKDDENTKYIVQSLIEENPDKKSGSESRKIGV